MPTIYLPTYRIEFGHALISVLADGSDRDWMCENWVDAPQQVELTHQQDSVLLTGRTRWANYLESSLCFEINPPIFSVPELVTYAATTAISEVSNRDVARNRQAVNVAKYGWGTLVTLQWHRLENAYAPGGDENYILPNNGRAIHIGFVRFNWEKIVCVPRGTTPSPDLSALRFGAKSR